MQMSALREWDRQLGFLCSKVDWVDQYYNDIREIGVGWNKFYKFMKGVPEGLKITVGLRIVEETTDSFVLERINGWGRLECTKNSTGVIVKRILFEKDGSSVQVGSDSIVTMHDVCAILAWIIPPAHAITDSNGKIKKIIHIDQEHEAKILLLSKFSYAFNH